MLPDPRELLEVQTLSPITAYSREQIASALLVAHHCHETFGNVRFVYAIPARAK